MIDIDCVRNVAEVFRFMAAQRRFPPLENPRFQEASQVRAGMIPVCYSKIWIRTMMNQDFL